MTQIFPEGASEDQRAEALLEPRETEAKQAVAKTKHVVGIGELIGKTRDTFTEKKGKVQPDVVEQTGHDNEPKKEGDEPQFGPRRSPLMDRPPISDAKPPIEPIEYRVPPVRRPAPNLLIRFQWPQQAGKP